MKLALREMRRRPGRFATATALLTLIAILLMLLGGLLDGLINRSTGAIRAQRADLVVFSATAEQSLLRSRITPEVRARVDTVEGVQDVGGIGVTQLGARVPGNGPRDLVDVALFGYQTAPDGVPAPPAQRRGVCRHHPAGRWRRARRHAAARTGADTGEGDRVRRRRELLGRGFALGFAGDVA